MMRPLPSRSPGWPAIIETKIEPDAVSTYTLSGVSTPSVTVHPAVTRPGAAGEGVAAAGGPPAVVVWSGAGDEVQADRAIPKTMRSGNRFTSEPPSGNFDSNVI